MSIATGAPCAVMPGRRHRFSIKLHALPIVLAGLGVGLAGCASAPRGEAGALAQSGLTATSQLSADIADLSHRVRAGDAQNAFSDTLTLCQTRPGQCAVAAPSSALSKARAKLAQTIATRAAAVNALHGAYAAMKTEADYDARADLTSAVDGAVKAASAYASAAGAGPAAQLLGTVADKGAGWLADRAQAKRLRSANLLLATAVERLEAGLAKEREIYASVAGDIVLQETAANQSLLDAGLVSSAQALQPLADSIGAVLVKDPDAALAKSPAARMATQAVLTAQSQQKVEAVLARYSANLDALDELKRQHLAAAQGKPLDLAGLDRALTQIDGFLSGLKAK